MTSPKPEEFLPIRYTDSSRKDLRFLSFGAGGFTLYMGEGSRLSGYRTRENFFRPSKYWSHQHKELEDPRLFEGLPWMDMTHLAKTPEGIRMSVCGPMVGPALKPWQRDCMDMSSVSDIMRYGLQGEFATMLMLADEQAASGSKEPGSLDKVSIVEYRHLWKQIGAHVGTIRSGCFVEIDDPPDTEVPLRPIKVWFDDGDFIETLINGTRKEVFDYYVGTAFEKSDETMHTAMSVEFL